MEFLEEGHGAVELSVDHTLVADEVVHAELDGEDEFFAMGDLAAGGPGVRGPDTGFAFAEVVYGLGLVAVGPAESPVADDEAFDEEGFGGALGLIFVDEAVKELVEVVPALVGVEEIILEEDLFGEDAVFKGVSGGSGLALRCSGPGGFLGVVAVGL